MNREETFDWKMIRQKVCSDNMAGCRKEKMRAKCSSKVETAEFIATHPNNSSQQPLKARQKENFP